MIPAHPIPFEHAELGIVPPADFAVAEHAPQLVAIPDARREQAFHRKLGRGTQPPLA